MSAHTPGPWVVADDSEPRTIIQCRAGGLICDTAIQETVAESRANNRLLAAAPELLEALRLALPALEAEAQRTQQYCWDSPLDPNGSEALERDHKVLRLARAAIAKAEGER